MPSAAARVGLLSKAFPFTGMLTPERPRPLIPIGRGFSCGGFGALVKRPRPAGQQGAGPMTAAAIWRTNRDRQGSTGRRSIPFHGGPFRETGPRYRADWRKNRAFDTRLVDARSSRFGKLSHWNGNRSRLSRSSDMLGSHRYLPINFAPPPDITGRGSFIYLTVWPGRRPPALVSGSAGLSSTNLCST